MTQYPAAALQGPVPLPFLVVKIRFKNVSGGIGIHALCRISDAQHYVIARPDINMTDRKFLVEGRLVAGESEAMVPNRRLFGYLDLRFHTHLRQLAFA